MNGRKYPYVTNGLVTKNLGTYSKTQLIWAMTEAEAIGLTARACEKQWPNEDGFSPPKVVVFMVSESDCIRIGRMVNDWPEK